MPECAHTHPELGPSALHEPDRSVACLLHAGDHELPEALRATETPNAPTVRTTPANM